MNLIVVSGQPGTGKTTLARALSSAVNVPVIEKDTIKEALHRILPAHDIGSSRLLGQATYEVMYALAPTFDRVILEANFWRESVPRLRSIDPHPIEIYCACPPGLALKRYAERHRDGPHFDDEMLYELQRRFEEDGQRALGLGGSLLEVDTTDAVDVARVEAWVDSQLESGRT